MEKITQNQGLLGFFSLTILFFIGTNCLFAQTVLKVFDKTYGGRKGDHLSVVVPTPDGGSLLGGTSSSGISYDKTVPNWGPGWEEEYSPDFWIVKVDAKGNKQWDKVYGGTEAEIFFNAIVPTKDGNYLIGGTSHSGISGDKTEPSRGGRDYWIVMINSEGDKLWDKTFGGNGYDHLRSIIPTSDGGYLIGGSSDSDVSGDKSEPSRGGVDYWIVKITSTGVKEWDKTFGGGAIDDYWDSDDLSSVVQTPDNGYLLAGYSVSSGGDKSEDNLDQYPDRWIVKISSDGTKEWDKLYRNPGIDYGPKIIAASDGGYILASHSDAGESGNAGRKYNNYRIAKINETGELLWDKTYGGDGYDNLTSTAATPDGGYILAGYSNSDEGFDKSEPSKSSSTDYWILKVNSEGDKEWDKTFGGTGGDNLSSLYINSQGEYILGGSSNSRVGDDKTHPRRGGSDYWLIKTTPEIAVPPSVTIKSPSLVIKDTPLQIQAEVFSFPCNISKVEFYRQNIKIGEDATAPYTLNTNSGSPGVTYISAKAIDQCGNEAISFTKPLTVTSSQTSLYKAINLNGPEIILDDIKYEASSNATHFTFQGKTYENRILTFEPTPEDKRISLLQSCVYSLRTAPAIFTFNNVPSGVYELYFHVMEDNKPSTYSIWINENLTLDNFNSGPAKSWDKLGPFKTEVKNGKIEIKITGGDGNIAGIEIHTLKDYEEFYQAVNANGITTTIDNLTVEGSGNVLQLYPNPVANSLFINSVDDLMGAKFKIIGPQGKEVLKGISLQNGIDISNLKPGIYNITIHANGKSITKKFIKN